eukprot:10017592-Heterocapsa_arctica.AAC.1
MRGTVDFCQGGHGLQPLPQEGGLVAVGRHAYEDVRVGAHRAAQPGHGREDDLAMLHHRRASELAQRVEVVLLHALTFRTARCRGSPRCCHLLVAAVGLIDGALDVGVAPLACGRVA